MTPDLRLLSGFARGVSLSLHVRVTCLHSGSWLLSGYKLFTTFQNPLKLFHPWLKDSEDLPSDARAMPRAMPLTPIGQTLAFL